MIIKTTKTTVNAIVYNKDSKETVTIPTFHYGRFSQKAVKEQALSDFDAKCVVLLDTEVVEKKAVKIEIVGEFKELSDTDAE